MNRYLQRLSDIIYWDVALLPIVQGVEPLDVLGNLRFRQADGDVVLAGFVDVLPHLTPEEDYRLLGLPGPLLFVPAELVPHDLHNNRERLLGRLDVEEGESEPPGDHIDRGGCVLLHSKTTSSQGN